MKGILKRLLVSATLSVTATWAGALVMEVGNPEANAEAKSMRAALVVRVTACHEPAKSVVTANLVQLNSGLIQRTPLKVVPLQTAGTFAVLGAVSEASAIDLAVTNPQLKNYEPRVLIRSNANGPRWASLRRFFSTLPTDADVKSVLQAED